MVNNREEEVKGSKGERDEGEREGKRIWDSDS